MRRGLLLGLGLLLLVGCGRAKSVALPTNVARSVVNVSNTPIPSPILVEATPLVSSVSSVANLRAEPSTDADIITTIDPQASILILAQRNDADHLWYRVRVNDYLGWMSASLFSLPADQQASLPWEQRFVATASPTVQPTNRPFPTPRPSSARPHPTTRPQAPSRPTKPKPPTTNKPQPAKPKPPTSNKPPSSKPRR
ncbi:SH3 domain-containing protein [Herpetosiphon llansteffanensis]|uniref:SH3 domain-containing protein n=1 Tax=Herpetosiphon llansteffanensis TaxID=2094568 RepID=UPI000D7C7140|nr:SH3 domain-containing protein [Herpetosiphon llansteffanensis]